MAVAISIAIASIIGIIYGNIKKNKLLFFLSMVTCGEERREKRKGEERERGGEGEGKRKTYRHILKNTVCGLI